MGLFRSIRHAVKKIGKASRKVATRSIKAVVNPVKTTKNLISDPLGFLAKTAGLDVLFAPNSGGAATGQNERVAYSSAGENELTSQDRDRMIARQGMQAALPTMLLGQDMTDTSLDRTDELGGRRNA